MIKTDQMGQALQNIFGETANEVARETQFVQRESKLSGIKFMQTFVLGFVQHPEASLNLLCQVAADLGVEITKQGLQKRLSSAAVAYMQAMFDRGKDTLQNKVPIPLALLTQFTAVQLVDRGEFLMQLLHERGRSRPAWQRWRVSFVALY